MLHLSLAMYIADTTTHAPDEPNGPLFNRWLPDGPADALVFPFNTTEQSLRIWFVRRGRMDGGFVRYASDKREVDESAMYRQGWLDAGPLGGEGTFNYVSADEMTAIRDDCRGSAEYLSVGKRVVNFLVAPLQGLIDTLRLQYGQYWLRELRPWDSRSASLGGYCQGVFHLRWRASQQDDWRPFLPDDPSETIRALPIPGRGYAEFLTRDDWQIIQETLNTRASHPLALRIAGRAHELSNVGYLSEAYIQAVTALELAIEHFLARRSTPFGKGVELAAGSFTNQPLISQLYILAIATGLIDPATAQAGARVIDARNKIVHEAKALPSLSQVDLLAALKCTQCLLGLGEFKSPRLTNGNKLSAPNENSG